MSAKNHGGGAVKVVLLCTALMAVVFLSLPHAAVGKITCDQVSARLAPCLHYLTKGGSPEMGCCNAVSALNDKAKSKSDRQDTCKCLKKLAKSIPNINLDSAEKLPDLCHVKVPYPISMKTDCDKVE